MAQRKSSEKQPNRNKFVVGPDEVSVVKPAPKKQTSSKKKK